MRTAHSTELQDEPEGSPTDPSRPTPPKPRTTAAAGACGLARQGLTQRTHGPLRCTRVAPEFISQPITPTAGTFDARAMSTGVPGLPAGFAWAGETFAIVELLERWKHTSREGSYAQGDVYLRRHYYRLKMSDGSVWTVYVLRQTPRSGSPKQRWFLLERAGPPPTS